MMLAGLPIDLDKIVLLLEFLATAVTLMTIVRKDEGNVASLSI